METTSTSNGGRSVSQLRLPAGFRFKPTDLELIWEYLLKQVNSEPFEYGVIAVVDLSQFHPRQLPDQALLRGGDEWFFLTQLERKYPKGTRPNRAAAEGYWKATGTDKKILKANHIGHSMVVGLKKALVFYEGKAPRGKKTNWIMHEYRLADPRLAPAAHIHHPDSTPPKEWVLCRIYEKHSSRAVGREVDLESMLCEFDDQITTDSPTQEQGVVDNATTSATFPPMIHNIPGAMSSTVPGVASSNSWTSNGSQIATLTQDFAVQTGLQTVPALNYVPQMQPFHRGPGSPSSFTAHDPRYYNACIGADAGQRSSFSGDLEVQSQLGNFVGYGEGALFPGLDHPLADDQSSTYSRANGMGNFGYDHGPPDRNS